MPVGAKLLNALRSFATVEREIVSLGERTDASNAQDFVRLRRDLVLEFAKLSAALESDPHLIAHPDKLSQATRLFAAFRTANSINQADWPAIRVRDNVESYRTAAQPVGERSHAFWSWIEQEFGFKR